MLSQLAQAAQRSGRTLTLRHPNSVDIVVYRKVLTRKAGQFAGKPTLGGAMVLSPEDEADYEIEELGRGKMLFLGRLEGAESVEEGLTYSEGEIRAYIEPLDEGSFTTEKYDRVFWIMPYHTLEYQVKKVFSTVNMPPYVNVYLLQPIEHTPEDNQLMP